MPLTTKWEKKMFNAQLFSENSQYRWNITTPETTVQSKICVTWELGESTMISGLNKWSQRLCESHNGIAQSIMAETVPKPLHKLIAYAHPFLFCSNQLYINSFTESTSRGMDAFSSSKDGCTLALDQYKISVPIPKQYTGDYGPHFYNITFIELLCHRSKRYYFLCPWSTASVTFHYSDFKLTSLTL